jgi:thiosulfate reductase cytochrome b subunit
MHAQLKKIYIYSRYERFWHWLQMVFIVILLVTGFEIHGTFSWLGFKQAVEVHNFIGITWLISFAFFVFWLFTTGEWKQYIPTTKKLLAVARYYIYDIFKGKPHPVPKRKNAKHNPLQRLTYLGIAALVLPAQMITGLFYWTYNLWDSWGLSSLPLGIIAAGHTIFAFAVLAFLVIHVYMTTTGHTVSAHIRGMITGWEEIEEGTFVAEWEQKTK